MGTLLERPTRIGLHPHCRFSPKASSHSRLCRHWPDESVSGVILDVNRICGRPSAIFGSLIFWSVHSARTMDRVLFLRRQLAMFRERKPERTTPRDLDRWLMACLLSSKTSVMN